MRKIAFGYSTLCNIRCRHCVAAGEEPQSTKMELDRAKKLIHELADANVGGISFTAGEPFIFFNDIVELVGLCRSLNIYTRVVTNCYWAASEEKAREKMQVLRNAGLSQLRLSFSRYHQEHVPPVNIVNAVKGCRANSIAYFVSFITDFSEEDDEYELFLQGNSLKYFPEPLIFAGRAENMSRRSIHTDYQENRCSMNPYLSPDMNLYACCDAGTEFTATDFFLLGNVNEKSIDALLTKSEADQLYCCIRNMGITPIASFAGLKAREIIQYRKCELCMKLFNSAENLAKMRNAAKGLLQSWVR